MRNYKEFKKRFDAVQAIFSESSTTIDKLKAVKTMLRGISPALDKKLDEYGRHLDTLSKLEQGDYIELTAEALPEATDAQKKRKAALLLFIKSWNELKGEVARIEAEMQTAQNAPGQDGSMWVNILKGAKGPLALVTILAVGVAALNVTAVEIEIRNDGCSTIESDGGIPVQIRGFSLSKNAIPDGDSAIATFPPLTIEVNGSNTDTLSLNAYGAFHLSFGLSGIDDIVFNGESLIGTTSVLELSEQKRHTLVVSCN